MSNEISHWDYDGTGIKFFVLVKKRFRKRNLFFADNLHAGLYGLKTFFNLYNIKLALLLSGVEI